MVFLIIDSSPSIAERLADIVTETGNVRAVYKAKSYAEAIQQLKEVEPDVVLLDVNLPGNKSIELLKKIKAGNKNFFFIILFNQPDAVIQQQCTSLGADFFFDKYHDFEKIPGAISVIANTKN